MNTPQERSSSGASVTARHEGNCPAWGRLPDTENSPSARPHGAQTLFGPGAIGRGGTKSCASPSSLGSTVKITGIRPRPKTTRFLIRATVIEINLQTHELRADVPLGTAFRADCLRSLSSFRTRAKRRTLHHGHAKL